MNKRNKTLFVIGTLLLVLVMGVSFAYYVMNIIFEGDGSSVAATIKQFGDVRVTYEGKINVDDTEILPGHKSISKLEVTATSPEGEKEIYFDVIYDGSTNFNLKYAIYKTTDESITLSKNCKEVEEVVS